MAVLTAFFFEEGKTEIKYAAFISFVSEYSNVVIRSS